MRMRFGLFNRVGNKLLLSFIVVAIMPMAAIAFFSQKSSTAAILKEAMYGQERLVNTRAEYLEEFFDDAHEDTLFLARSHALQRYLEAVALRNSAELDVSFEGLSSEFRELAANRDSIYEQLAYIDELGQETVVVTINGDEYANKSRSEMQNRSSSELFKSAMEEKRGRTYASRLGLLRDAKGIVKPLRGVINFATPVFYPNGRRAGIVMATVRASLALDKLGSMLLLSEEGFYLYHSDPNKRWGAPQDLNTKESFASNDADLWQKMQPTAAGSLLDDSGNYKLSYRQVIVPGSDQFWWLIQPALPEMRLDTAFGGGFFLVFGVVLLISMIIAYAARNSILKPLNKLISVVHRVASGDQNARAEIRSGDELQELGMAFDQMVDERIATLAKMEAENEALNNSIIELMEATAKLSENDLSIHVPVREDITGVVADGLNKMIKGTNEVLHRIKTVAQEVAAASNTVKERSDSVIQLAQEERQVVEETLRNLDKTAQAIQGVADLAQACNTTADRASGTTGKALETVTGTVEGMNEIREIISETEKRIKRLGERSQEINSVVEIINNIAERTHVLALNASMQAAAAGEAGRGFAVVADEVQRLAENSRNSTSQIAALVHNIQTETSETMLTMNKTISQVVNGSELAELAGRQMRETQATTTQLVEAVMKISDQAVAQSIAINELRRDAAGIRRSTQVTGQQLEEQAETTDAMVGYAQALQEAVQIFTLKASM